jgi:hypothetical protein
MCRKTKSCARLEATRSRARKTSGTSPSANAYSKLLCAADDLPQATRGSPAKATTAIRSYAVTLRLPQLLETAIGHVSLLRGFLPQASWLFAHDIRVPP